MESHNPFSGPQWHPFSSYGFTHPFWSLNQDTIIATSLVTTIIIAFSLFASWQLKKKDGMIRFVILQYVKIFKDFVTQSLNHCPLNHLAFTGSLFTFILLCNISSLLPLIEEPTKDINATLALGFISFFYVQGHAIAHHGFIEYAKGFLEPFFIMLPLNLLGTLTSIISLSFRLFGNIFGGYTITSLYHTLLSQSIFYELIGVCSGFNLFMSVVFTLFEGTMQAFVFSMLSLTFLSMEISSESENNEGISA